MWNVTHDLLMYLKPDYFLLPSSPVKEPKSRRFSLQTFRPCRDDWLTMSRYGQNLCRQRFRDGCRQVPNVSMVVTG